jgi:hypothetical protein
MARDRTALGWDRLILGPLAARRIDGDHNTIFDPPHVSGLTAEIVHFLAGTAAEARAAVCTQTANSGIDTPTMVNSGARPDAPCPPDDSITPGCIIGHRDDLAMHK